MSTNSNCDILEVERGKWFYILEHLNAPKNSWDWREYASCYGPFASEEATQEHLRDNHPNPGGSCTTPLPDGVATLDLSKDEVLARLVKEAHAPRSSSSAFGFGWR